MTNSFKSGSGNLDFGSNDNESSETGDQNDTKKQAEERKVSDKEESSKETSGGAFEQPTEQTTTGENNQSDSTQAKGTPSEEYPYYIRRNNIGDERDKRLELHVRNTVTSDEPMFRSKLADELDVDEVAKTDAREAALLFAFQNPEKVAELLQEEGYGVFG